MSEPLPFVDGRLTTDDLRLFGFAVGVWGGCLAGLWLRSAPTWWCGAAAAVAALTVVALRPHIDGVAWLRRYRPRHLRPLAVWAAAALLLGVTCGLVATAARTGARDAPQLQALARDHAAVVVQLVVVDDPRDVVSTRPGPPTVIVPVRVTRISAGGRRELDLDVRAVVFANDSGWQDLLPTQAAVARGRLSPAPLGDLTAVQLTAIGSPELIGRPQWTQRAAATLRAGLREAVAPLPAEPAGLLPGLAIGDTSRLDPALANDFRRTGLTHLVAVSGANVLIIIGSVMFVSRWLRAGTWLSAGLAALALVGFVILVRPSPSVVRAAAMGSVGLLALVSGRVRIATAALAAAVVGALLFDPALAGSAGFSLSVLATGALVLLAPRWRDRLRARAVPAGLAEALAVPAAAQVVCAPIIAALAGQLSLVAMPANLLAAPAVAPATVLGVSAAVVSRIWPAGAAALAWAASWPARWLAWVAHAGAHVPAAALPWLAGWPGALLMVAVIGAGWLLLRFRTSRRVLLVVAVGALVGAAPVRWLASGWPPAGSVIIACDVGQGDALVLPVQTGTAVVVDTGPDPLPVDGCLRALGVDTVSLLVLTHFHADHIDGLPGVLRGRHVDELALPVFAEPATGAATVHATATAAAVPSVEVGAGWSFHDGDVELRAIGPVRALGGTRSDPNNNSLVLLAEVHGITVLLMGDAEVEEQGTLLDQPLHADVLKVAHHGSSYQDERLLDAIGARVALVSVGAGNPYGHPNAAVLKHLGDLGMRVLRTDIDGDIAVVATPDGLGIATRHP